MDMINLYEILSLESECTDEQIKSAYSKLVKKYHPDKGGNVELYELITNAYDILRKPETRQEYDRLFTLSRQSSQDFNRLKQQSKDYYDSGEYKAATDTQKIDFKSQMSALNDKHGFDPSAQYQMSALDAKKRYSEIMHSRQVHDQEDQQAQLFEKKNFDLNDLKKFNQAFDQVHRKGDDLVLANGVPIAWNSGSLTSYTPIDNLEQIYADDNSLDPIGGTTYFSSIDYTKGSNKLSKEDVAGLGGAGYVDGHNKKDDSYYVDMKRRLNDRQSDTTSFNSRKLADFKNDDTAGYGIMEQVGIKQYDRITLDEDFDDVQTQFERLMKERGKPMSH
jgi:curved DNA-binding protein CbpA